MSAWDKKLKPRGIIDIFFIVAVVAVMLFFVAAKFELDEYTKGLNRGYALQGTYSFNDNQPSLTLRLNTDEDNESTWQYYDGRLVHTGRLVETEDPNRYVLKESSNEVYAQIEISRRPSAQDGVVYLTFVEDFENTYMFSRVVDVPTTLDMNNFPESEVMVWPRPHDD